MPYLIQTEEPFRKRNLSFFFLKSLIGFTNLQLETWGVFNTYTKIKTQDFVFPENSLVLLSEFNNQVYFLRQSKYHLKTIETELSSEIRTFSPYSTKGKAKRVWFSVFDFTAFEKAQRLFQIGKYSHFPEEIKEQLFMEYQSLEAAIRTPLYRALYPSEKDLKALAARLHVRYGEEITEASEIVSIPDLQQETVSLQWIE